MSLKNPGEKIPDYAQTKEKALRLLEFRTHSERELFVKLKRTGAEDETINSVMEFLKEYNLIDDEKYAVNYALDLQNLKKLGKNRIAGELSKKGIAREYIQKAIDNLPDLSDGILSELVSKRLKGNFDNKNKEKAIRYFLYRGYSLDEIKKSIREAETKEDNYGL